MQNFPVNSKLSKVNVVLSQTKDQFLFNQCINEDMTKCNSFLFSNVICLTNNFNILTQQFAKFAKFVTSQKDPHKAELSNLFGPVICHLFIECIKGKESSSAIEFLKSNVSLISLSSNEKQTKYDERGQSFSIPSHREFFQKLVQNLSLCKSYEDVEINESIQTFRCSKYELDFSLETLLILRTYLENDGHVLILNVLNTWIHIMIPEIFDGLNSIKITDKKENHENNDILENHLNNRKSSEPQEDEDEKPDNFHLDNLKNSVRKLLQIEFPNRYFKITDSENTLTSADLDPAECHLLAGFNNSMIKLWQLNESQLLGKHLYANVNQKVCPWEINNLQEGEEEELSEDEEEVKESSQIAIDMTEPGEGIVLRGHNAGVTAVRFSKHFPVFLSTSKDNTMRVWKANNLQCQCIYKGHNYPVWCMDESPISTYVATGSRDHTARIWNLERSHPLITYVGHTQDVDTLAFHPNGNYIATGSADQTVRLWCVTSGKLLRVFTEPKGAITCVQFSPNGKYLAAGGEEQKLRIFDLEAGNQLAELKDLTSGVNYLCWSDKGNKLAACCGDASLRMWDVSNLGTSNQCSRLLTQYSDCNTLVKIIFNKNKSLSCVGSDGLF